MYVGMAFLQWFSGWNLRASSLVGLIEFNDEWDDKVATIIGNEQMHQVCAGAAAASQRSAQSKNTKQRYTKPKL